MAKKKQRRDVVFRRINGRVVPIRRQANYDTEKKVAAGGIATQVVGAAAVGAGLASEKTVDVEDFKKKYAKDIKKTGVTFKKTSMPTAMYVTKDVDPKLVNLEMEKLRDRINKGQIKSPVKGFLEGLKVKKKALRDYNEIRYSKEFQKESILLHELGHAKSKKRKFSANRLYLTDKGGAAAKIMKAVTRPFANLVLEAEASGEAVGMAYKQGGAKKASKVGLRMIGPYGTYLGNAMLAGAGVSALYKYSRSKKDGKKKKK